MIVFFFMVKSFSGETRDNAAYVFSVNSLSEGIAFLRQIIFSEKENPPHEQVVGGF